MPRAVVFGCAGTTLSAAERDFFRAADPLGFILFKRNCDEPAQVRRLVAALRDAVGRDAPVMIDQEGGRVARLRPPHWPSHPPAWRFAELAARDRDAAVQACRLNHRLLGAMLADLGITVDCAPVLDLRFPGAHDVVGDRAFGADPETVVALAGAAAEGLLDAGVAPVVKHMPGHGRALVDSHHDLPVTAATLEDLQALDFAPFRALAHMPWGMTAHVVYTALDAERPGTLSPVVVAQAIRGHIGFQGFLVSDDIEMNALKGTAAERSAAALAGGLDAVLHCSGRLGEMESAASAIGALSAAAAERFDRAEAMRRERAGGAFDAVAARAALDAALALDAAS